MRKIILVLLTLCLLATAVGHAEGAVIVKDAFKITFITADFRDNWAEYAGGDSPSPDAARPQYCLRVYVMDRAATSSYNRLSDQLRGWHLLDPDGNIYDSTSGSYYQTDGLYRDLIMIFKRAEPLAGAVRYEPGDMLLATDWKSEAIPLDSVPQDVPETGPEPTPVPTEPPDDVLRANGLLAAIKAGTADRQEEAPILTGKLAVVVYRDWDDEDPVLSYQDDRFVRDSIPGERLAEDFDSADMVVFIWPEFKSVGMYSSGAIATRCMTKVCVYDQKADKLFLPETVATNEPPKTVNDRKSHSGNFEPFTGVDWIAERLGE